ncbi:hypothetical protein MMC22_001797 [Lobaria immixta]|nr:hypothetical protein [Lobaria immixta]
MADRFPSLEDFSSGQTEGVKNGTTDNLGSNADDDFLTRERALLGDDAAQFTSPNDNVASAKVEDSGEVDLLGDEGDYNGGHTGGQDFTQFESAFPTIDTRNEGVAPGGTITGSDSITQPNRSQYDAYGKVEEQEPEPMRQWRERRDLDLERRAKISAEKKAETIASAQKWTDEFYENYNRKKDKSLAKARKDEEEFLAGREDTSAGGTSWERIAKLVDLSGKGARGGAAGTGKEKFRELLVGLKGDAKAPGAGGY